jgi:hypothetical protein
MIKLKPLFYQMSQLTWFILQTTTDGKNTSVSGTLPSNVVWTVEFKNSKKMIY